jgi:hypothetical protein
MLSSHLPHAIIRTSGEAQAIIAFSCRGGGSRNQRGLTA